MTKYRTVEFANGKFGIQKRFLFIWWLQGMDEFDNHGFSAGWYPLIFNTLHQARQHIKDRNVDPYKIIKTHP